MKVTFYLAAMTRQECAITLEVPDDTTDAMLDDMALDIRESADGSEYTEDMEYWEEEPERWEKDPHNDWTDRTFQESKKIKR